VKSFALHFHGSPEEMGEEEIREYLHYLIQEKKASQCGVSRAYSALKFFYETTLKRDWKGYRIRRVALSNERLVSLSGDQVTLLTLEALEFIRRFLLHVLPDRFVKVRHYGLLSNRSRKRDLGRCRELLGVWRKEEAEEAPQETWEEILTRLTGIDPRVCPFCGQGKMMAREILPALGISPAGRISRYAGRSP
jgi:hypothetical protein